MTVETTITSALARRVSSSAILPKKALRLLPPSCPCENSEGYSTSTPQSMALRACVASARVGRRRERVTCPVLEPFQQAGAGGPGGDALEDRGDAL